MSNITIYFAGHFGCRLATNPDPFDEPRGRSGWTRAYPGEPDLDRVIRFSPALQPVREPYIQQPVQVFRTSPGDNDNSLLGAAVELRDVDGRFPCFEGRDGIVAEARKERIFPLVVRVTSTAGLCIEKEYCKTLIDIDSQVEEPIPYPDFSEALKAELGLLAIAEYLHGLWFESLAIRIECLTRMRETTESESDREIFDHRLRTCISLKDGVPKKTASYKDTKRCQRYASESKKYPGIVTLWPSDEQPVLSETWPLELFFFGFDQDALAGICVGKLTLPLSSSSNIGKRSGL